MKNFIITTMLLSMGFTASAQNDPFWSVLHNNDSVFKATIVLNHIEKDIILKDGIPFIQLSISDESSTIKNIGEPALPTLSKLIYLPSGADFSVSIEDSVWEDFMCGEYLISPYQETVRDTEQEKPFFINDSVYNLNEYPIPVITTSERMCWRDDDNINLTYCPFRYSPKENKLRYLKTATIVVRFSYRSEACLDNPRRINKLASSLYSLPPQIRTNGTSVCITRYLIIVGNSSMLNSQAIIDFKTWKTRLGYDVKVVSTSTTGTTSSSIKSYIQNEYNTSNLEYVLFVGDHDAIPLYNHVGFVDPNITIDGDYYYACLAGNDMEADVAIGRFSTNSLIDLQNMVNKTIAYQTNANQHFNNVLLVAHLEEAPSNYQGCSETIRNNYYDNPIPMSTAYGASINVYGDNASNADVINHINSGCEIINYRGHGNINCWWQWNIFNQDFTNNYVDSLNTVCNPIIFSIACQTGNINSEPCMMEAFTRSVKGAVAFLASTFDNYESANNYFDKTLFNKLLGDNSIFHLGWLNVLSHIHNMNFNQNKAKECALSYICAGDPSLSIFTSTPQTFNVSSYSYSSGTLTLNFNSSKSFYISVVGTNGNLLNLYSYDNVTNASIPINQDCYVTLFAHNHIPLSFSYNSQTTYIQNISITNNKTYIDSVIMIGSNVTDIISHGDVIINNGANVNIQGSNAVLITNGFECKAGATLEICN